MGKPTRHRRGGGGFAGREGAELGHCLKRGQNREKRCLLFFEVVDQSAAPLGRFLPFPALPPQHSRVFVLEKSALEKHSLPKERERKKKTGRVFNLDLRPFLRKEKMHHPVFSPCPLPRASPLSLFSLNVIIHPPSVVIVCSYSYHWKRKGEKKETSSQVFHYYRAGRKKFFLLILIC